MRTDKLYPAFFPLKSWRLCGGPRSLLLRHTALDHRTEVLTFLFFSDGGISLVLVTTTTFLWVCHQADGEDGEMISLTTKLIVNVALEVAYTIIIERQVNR